MGLKNKSIFVPPTNSPAAELFIDKVETDIRQFLEDRSRIDHRQNNLSREEHIALSLLSTRKEITIKPEDKGGSIVVMDTAKYEGEIKRQLADHNVYTRLDTNPITRVLTKIKKSCKEGPTGSNNRYQYRNLFNTRTSHCTYLLCATQGAQRSE